MFDLSFSLKLNTVLTILIKLESVLSLSYFIRNKKNNQCTQKKTIIVVPLINTPLQCDIKYRTQPEQNATCLVRSPKYYSHRSKRGCDLTGWTHIVAWHSFRYAHKFSSRECIAVVTKTKGSSTCFAYCWPHHIHISHIDRFEMLSFVRYCVVFFSRESKPSLIFKCIWASRRRPPFELD